MLPGRQIGSVACGGLGRAAELAAGGRRHLSSPDWFMGGKPLGLIIKRTLKTPTGSGAAAKAVRSFNRLGIIR